MEKIIHICQSSIGGTVEYLRLFLENLDKKKYENILVCPSSGNMKKTLNKYVKKIYIVEMCREISMLKDIVDIIKIREILKDENPDVLYLHSSKAGALGRIASIGLKNKIIYNPHGWSFAIECSQSKKKIYSIIERILYPLTDKIINISIDEYNKALDYNLNKIKLVIIENGIDIEKFKNNKKEEFLDRFVVGFVGRLSEQKNPLYLVKIVEKIKNKIPNILFYVVGNGELKSKLLEEIQKKKLEKYFFLRGWSEKVEEEIKNFDIALMISKWEGFGLVVCEYMAAEKPVVAFRVGGVKNIIVDKKNGILTNEEKIVEDIIKLYSNKDLQKRLAIEGKKTVIKNFLIKDVIKKHEEIFELTI